MFAKWYLMFLCIFDAQKFCGRESLFTVMCHLLADYIKSCACMEVCRQVVMSLDVSFLSEVWVSLENHLAISSLSSWFHNS